MTAPDTARAGRAAAAPSTGARGPLFAVRGLDVRYDGEPALRGVDLDVAEGRITALVGPSGCGKTTLLQCLDRLTDLIAGCVVRGSVRFDGRELVGRAVDLRALRADVGMVFQKPNPFPLSVRANLHLALREHGCPRAELDRVTEEVLREVGLWDEVAGRLGRPALALSGGQQQRLCIARALTLRPRVLLMDEPCSSLDPRSTEAVEALVRRLAGDYTVVVVTHDLAQARRLADDVAVLWSDGDGGRLVEAGPAREVLEAPTSEEARAYLSGRLGLGPTGDGPG